MRWILTFAGAASLVLASAGCRGGTTQATDARNAQAAIAPATATGQAPSGPQFEKHSAGGLAMFIPSGWRNLDELPGPLYLNGDGLLTPPADKDGPIQVGIAIERYPNQRGAAIEGARQNLAAGKNNPRLRTLGEGMVEQIKLTDGTDAAYLSIEFIKDGSRRSLQQKVFAKDGNSTGYVILGWIVTAKDSRFLDDHPQAAALLRAYLQSLVFDESKLSDVAVRAASAKFASASGPAQ